MKKLALSLAALFALSLAAPAFAEDKPAAESTAPAADHPARTNPGSPKTRP